jgi:hypothetical protein
VAREFDPDDVSATLSPLPLVGDQLVDGIAAMLGPSGLGRGGAWVLGVEGASAEVTADGAAVEVSRSGRVVEAVTVGAALRVRVAAGARLFADPDAAPGAPVVLGAPRASLRGAADVVTFLGHDDGAIRPRDRSGTLVDLGLGQEAASFGVRSEDPQVLDLLQQVAGQTWRRALEEVGAALVAASPARVVRTALARAEVTTPIPGPAAASPEGPHTHLLAPRLELGRELPVGISLPPGHAPAATFHPPVGWEPPRPPG